MQIQTRSWKELTIYHKLTRDQREQVADLLSPYHDIFSDLPRKTEVLEIGKGACRDTSPDLSIWSDAGAIAWSNSFEDLGSDHRVLCVTVGEDESEVDICRKTRVVDWDKFRETREREKQDGPIEDIGEWCRILLADVERATKKSN
ncbi:hypothetical protein HPB52_002430 [Rhipicephalus sanguineus]|uniref:Endonuclease/exonuclease/phosphatase domain-containing protein n=1 Tax=Rhipicephalus sanguineus TaxID=34632 RepID=A0A9D4PPZ8_RHISA|nr:hypothetical protein HPB52_002430 [Rhipicephalus sanguineus]